MMTTPMKIKHLMLTMMTRARRKKMKILMMISARSLTVTKALGRIGLIWRQRQLKMIGTERTMWTEEGREEAVGGRETGTRSLLRRANTGHPRRGADTVTRAGRGRGVDLPTRRAPRRDLDTRAERRLCCQHFSFILSTSKLTSNELLCCNNVHAKGFEQSIFCESNPPLCKVNLRLIFQK